MNKTMEATRHHHQLGCNASPPLSICLPQYLSTAILAPQINSRSTQCIPAPSNWFHVYGVATKKKKKDNLLQMSSSILKRLCFSIQCKRNLLPIFLLPPGRQRGPTRNARVRKTCFPVTRAASWLWLKASLFGFKRGTLFWFHLQHWAPCGIQGPWRSFLGVDVIKFQ